MKKQFKAFVSLLLVLCFVLSLASCKEKSKSVNKTKKGKNNNNTSSYTGEVSSDTPENVSSVENEVSSKIDNTPNKKEVTKSEDYSKMPHYDNNYSSVESSNSNPQNSEQDNRPVSTKKWRQDKFYLSSCWPYAYSAGSLDQKTKSIDLCKECGLNLVELPINCSDDVLSYCDKAGINAIAGSSFFQSSALGSTPIWNDTVVKNEIYKIYKHKSVIGYYYWDEIGKDSMNKAKNLKNNINKYDPARLAYSCLFPSYGIINWGESLGGGQWGDNSYYNYVKDYLDVVDPPVLSFDYYTFALDKSLNINIRDWYRDLGLYRKFSLEYNKPFWNYIGTDCMNDGGEFTNIAQTRVQLNIALAYGAKTISYYTTVKYLYDEKNFEKTEFFEDVKKENKKAMAMGNFLFDKTGTEIYHYGLKNTLENDYSEIYFLDDISKSKIIESVVASDGMIISMFKDKNNKQYMMVVTKNLKSKSAIEITLKGNKKVSTFNTSTKKLENPTTTNMITYKFLPGEAVIFSIN